MLGARNTRLPGSLVNWSYDGLRRRVQKSNGKLYWYGTGSDPLDETDASGNLTGEYIFFGGARVARRDYQNNVSYYFADHLGTAHGIERVLSGQNTGTFCYDADFYPFGVERTVTDSCDSAYKFTGKERDSESGLDNFGARYDASNLGRFMSPDPLFGHSGDPQTLNKYAYVGNNPITFNDPSGLSPGYYMQPNHEGEWCQGVRAMEGEMSEMDRAEAAWGASMNALWVAGGGSSQQQAQNQETPESLKDEIPGQVRLALATLILDSDSPTADDKQGGFHEEYAVAGKNEFGDWTISKDKPGAHANPDTDHIAQPSYQPRDKALADAIVDPRVFAHVHPSGTTATHAWVQPPSKDADIPNAAQGKINIVFGARDKKVYFYNTSGVIGEPMKLKHFVGQ